MTSYSKISQNKNKHAESISKFPDFQADRFFTTQKISRPNHNVVQSAVLQFIRQAFLVPCKTVLPPACPLHATPTSTRTMKEQQAILTFHVFYNPNIHKNLKQKQKCHSNQSICRIDNQIQYITRLQFSPHLLPGQRHFLCHAKAKHDCQLNFK